VSDCSKLFLPTVSLSIAHLKLILFFSFKILPIDRMFSIARFREVTGDYPKKITVVSFSFKQRRFETLHAPALRWPADRFVYVGVNPPSSTGFDLKRSTEGESKNAAAPFEQDPYGCHSEILQEKRKGRNPFHRTPPYVRMYNNVYGTIENTLFRSSSPDSFVTFSASSPCSSICLTLFVAIML
jgi:hypothetical protein